MNLESIVALQQAQLEEATRMRSKVKPRVDELFIYFQKEGKTDRERIRLFYALMSMLAGKIARSDEELLGIAEGIKSHIEQGRILDDAEDLNKKATQALGRPGGYQ